MTISNLLLLLLYLLLCVLQWYLSAHSPHFLSHLPENFYIAVVAVALLKTLLNRTTDPMAVVGLLLGLCLLVLLDIAARRRSASRAHRPPKR